MFVLLMINIATTFVSDNRMFSLTITNTATKIV